MVDDLHLELGRRESAQGAKLVCGGCLGDAEGEYEDADGAACCACIEADELGVDRPGLLAELDRLGASLDREASALGRLVPDRGKEVADLAVLRTTLRRAAQEARSRAARIRGPAQE